MRHSESGSSLSGIRWVSFLSKETHFFALSPVPLLLLSYESRCASRGAQPTFLVVNGKCPTKWAGLALKHRAKAAHFVRHLPFTARQSTRLNSSHTCIPHAVFFFEP